MNKYLDNYYRLFSEDDKEVYKAVLEKKDWVLVPLFLPGDLSITHDEKGQKHFKGIEALFDDVIPFEKLDDDKLDGFRFVKFKKSIKGDKHPHFYIEYDFNKIDQKGYQTIVANFYPCMTKEELDIIKESSDIKELLKRFMIGNDNEAVIILHEQNLLNNAFFAPVMRRVIVDKKAPQEVKDVLKELHEEKGVEYVEKDFIIK